MRKCFVARCAFVALMVSMLATSGADKMITDKEHGFEITYPEKWMGNEVSIAPDTTHVLAAKGQLESVTARVIFVPLAEEITLKEFSDREISAMSNNRREKSTASEKVEVKAGNLAAYKVTFLIGEANDPDRDKIVAYFVVAGKRGYVIFVGAPEKDYDKYATEIDAIVKSFKLIDTK